VEITRNSKNVNRYIKLAKIIVICLGFLGPSDVRDNGFGKELGHRFGCKYNLLVAAAELLMPKYHRPQRTIE
jgi:hypothetical protein